MVFVYYNLTNLTNAGNETTILTFIEGTNSILNGVPALLMLVAIYIILILALIGKGFDVLKTIAASSFAMMILAIILYPMNLISGFTLIVFCTLVPVSIFLLWVWGGRTI